MEELKTVLVVDDTELNIDILMELLDDKYDILASIDGIGALEILDEEKVDLILLDIMMPQMDGFEVCRIIKNNPKIKHIPVIFITAKTDEDSIERAYDVGGVDYITKPFRAKEVLSRIENHLTLFEYSSKLEDKVMEKTKELHKLNQELINTQKEIIYTMGTVGEYRSRETGNHVKRVALYSEILAIGYGMSVDEAKMLRDVSPMHDIGKIAIEDDILKKPARFTPQEFEKMKQHTSFGYEILKNSTKELLRNASIIAYEHHEKWDGTGYPNGLKGEEIHIYSRITAVADVFDALGSDRVYKKAWSDEKVFQLLKDEKGKHFEPKIIDVFFQDLDKILEIKSQFCD